MLITFLVMKLAFDGILKECNRIAFERELTERGAHLKSRLARLEIDHYKGVIDSQAYEIGQTEILRELDEISKQKFSSDGDTSVEI